MNSSIWTLDETLTSTITPGQSGPGSNGNEGVPDTPQSSRTGDLQRDADQPRWRHYSLSTFVYNNANFTSQKFWKK